MIQDFAVVLGRLQERVDMHGQDAVRYGDRYGLYLAKRQEARKCMEIVAEWAEAMMQKGM